MMSMAFIRNSNLLPTLPVIALALFVWSGLPLSLLLARFRAPAFILLSVSIFLILFSGEKILFSIGRVSIRSEGMIMALHTSLRVLSIIAVGIVMVHTTMLSGLSARLTGMGIPIILVDIAILTGRYIMVIGEDYRRMRTARKLRGYVPGWSISRRFSVAVPTSATLLIKGFQQSESVFNAMRMRGYGIKVPEKSDGSILRKHSSRDILLFAMIMLVSAVLIILEIF